MFEDLTERAYSVYRSIGWTVVDLVRVFRPDSCLPLALKLRLLRPTERLKKLQRERRKRDIRPVLETEKTWEVSEFWVCKHTTRGQALRYVLELEKGVTPEKDQASEILCGPFDDQADATSVVLKMNLQEELDRKARKGTQ